MQVTTRPRGNQAPGTHFGEVPVCAGGECRSQRGGHVDVVTGETGEPPGAQDHASLATRSVRTRRAVWGGIGEPAFACKRCVSTVVSGAAAPRPPQGTCVAPAPRGLAGETGSDPSPRAALCLPPCRTNVEQSVEGSVALVPRKAEEHLRLSRLKCGGLSARTTETSRAVMCLDLAASLRSCPLDRAYAAKLSGVNQKTYQSCLRSFECLLGLNSSVGIQDLAVQFSCTEAVNLAVQMLQSYESSLPQAQRADLDLSRPLFTTAALLTACKILKLKVDKGKMAATSGVKKAIFDRLCKQLEKIGQRTDRQPRDAGSLPRKRQKTEDGAPGMEREKVEEVPPKPQSNEDPALDYEEWKRKILENAARAQEAGAE
ncbi:PREDICTED: origin recognition complex subunit 6 [Myotis davidii]|uniref:origin recognition complex subunit 6 n=1 Tax=Myotis davidii TaxID=225400 RepID=UPI0007678E52|nr:PREDICTED: origin recognition complex subunit 6 [Myotis davidii]